MGLFNDEVCCTAYPAPADRDRKVFRYFRLQTMLDFRNHPLIIYRSVLNERILNILHQAELKTNSAGMVF